MIILTAPHSAMITSSESAAERKLPAGRPGPQEVGCLTTFADTLRSTWTMFAMVCDQAVTVPSRCGELFEKDPGNHVLFADVRLIGRP
jgi:hypothetical protein